MSNRKPVLAISCSSCLLLGSIGCEGAADQDAYEGPAVYGTTQDEDDENQLGHHGSGQPRSEEDLIDPLGIACGSSTGEPLNVAWAYGDAPGVPTSLEVALPTAVAHLSVELQILDGAEFTQTVIERADVEGKQTFEVPITKLSAATDKAGGAGFAMLSAVVIASDSTGRAISAGTLPDVHLRRDPEGVLNGFTPREATEAFRQHDERAPDLEGAYPNTVVFDGSELQPNVAIQVFSAESEGE